jgi:hypothetical protein
VLPSYQKKKDFFCIFEISKNLYVFDNQYGKITHLKQFEPLHNTKRQRKIIDFYQLPVSVALYYKTVKGLPETSLNVKKHPLKPMTTIRPHLLHIPPDSLQMNFRSHIPQTSGFILYRGIKTYVRDTCTIDYYLFAMWVLSKLIPTFTNDLPKLPLTQLLINIITHKDNLEWDMARQIWIVNIIKYKKIDQNKREISMFGSESEMFIQHLKEYQIHEFIKNCNPLCTENGQQLHRPNRQQGIVRQSNELHFERNANNNLSLKETKPDTENCINCNHLVSIDRRFINKPNFLFIYDDISTTKVYDLPKELTIDNKRYHHLCSHGYNAALKHFVGFFEIDNNLYLVDDLGKKCDYIPSMDINLNNSKINNLPITSSLYYMIQPL